MIKNVTDNVVIISIKNWSFQQLLFIYMFLDFSFVFTPYKCLIQILLKTQPNPENRLFF